MEAIQLEDIIPSKPEFFIAKTNKSYSIRPPNMADRVWIKETFGSEEEFGAILKREDWKQICRIIYRLMESIDREDFLAQSATIVNEEGDKLQARLTGPEVLFVSLAGLEESAKMLGALTRAIMISNPLIGKVIEEEIKKNLSTRKSKTPSPSIGPQSSTPSKANTGGRKKKSRS